MYIRREGFEFIFNPSVCKSCPGYCCNGESGNIWINRKDVEAISVYLGIQFKEFIENYLSKNSYRYTIKEIKVNNNYACIFYDEKQSRCSIYPVRPLQCRTFPFWDHFKKHWNELKEECPGVMFD